MTIKDQLLACQAALQKFADKEGGVCEIAGDVAQMINVLALKPGDVRIVLVWLGETVRGDVHPEEQDRVDRKFWAVFSRGKGFGLEASASLTKGSAGGRPLYEIVEAGRDIIRTLQLDPETTEHPIYYKGAQPYHDPNFPGNDAVYVEFEIGTDIGMMTNDPNA